MTEAYPSDAQRGSFELQISMESIDGIFNQYTESFKLPFFVFTQIIEEKSCKRKKKTTSPSNFYYLFITPYLITLVLKAHLDKPMSFFPISTRQRNFNLNLLFCAGKPRAATDYCEAISVFGVISESIGNQFPRT